MVLPTDRLRLGMFVVELDRPWLETPFPIQGFHIANRTHIDDLRSLCSEIVIDLRRSAWYSIAHLGERKARSIAARLAGLVAAICTGWPKERGARAGFTWKSLLPRPESSRIDAQPAQRRRLEGIPDNIQLVIYRDTKPFEEAIAPARDVYRQLDATMESFMSDVAEKRVISVDAISVAASQLVDTVAMNSEVMMWLVRMQAQSVHAYTHGVEVAVYLVTLGRHLGFPRDHLKNLCMTGLLLDVGLMRIDKALLDKPGPLTNSEMVEVRRHVGYGLDMLGTSPNIDPDVREAIAQHHERTDGSGYPLGLTGDKMCIGGRMAAIADTFAALTTRRPYAEANSVFNSMKTLLNDAGKKFHEPLVEHFVQAIGLFPVGSLVELSTGEAAAVIGHNKVRRLQPRVLVLTDPDKQLLASPFELNLLYDPKDANERPVRIRRDLPMHAYGINPRNYFLT